MRVEIGKRGAFALKQGCLLYTPEKHTPFFSRFWHPISRWGEFDTTLRQIDSCPAFSACCAILKLPAPRPSLNLEVYTLSLRLNERTTHSTEGLKGQVFGGLISCGVNFFALVLALLGEITNRRDVREVAEAVMSGVTSLSGKTLNSVSRPRPKAGPR